MQNKISLTESFRHTMNRLDCILQEDNDFTNSEEEIDKAISIDPKLVLNIPNALIPKYRNQILEVLEDDPSLLKTASDAIRGCFDILKELVTVDDYYLEYVSPTTPGYLELCKFAINEHSARILEFIPGEVMKKHPELYRLSIISDGWALAFTPDELITPELCKIAVTNCGNALEYVPDEMKTPEICKIAVDNDPNAWEFVPNPN